MTRAVRKDSKARDERRAALGLPEHVQLLPGTAADAEAAALVPFGAGGGFERAQWHLRREILSGSIFNAPAQNPARASGPGEARGELRGVGNGSAAAPPSSAVLAGADSRRQGMPGAAGLPAAHGRGVAVQGKGVGNSTGRPPLRASGGISKPRGAQQPRSVAAKAALALKQRRMSGVRLAFSSPA